MIDTLLLTIPDAIPLNRPRATCIKGKPRFYCSQKAQKTRYGMKIRQQLHEIPHFKLLTGLLKADITFGMGGAKKRTEGLYKIERPDLDNLCKFVFDVMNGIVYADDRQIVEMSARKVFSFKKYTIIKIWELSELDA